MIPYWANIVSIIWLFLAVHQPNGVSRLPEGAVRDQVRPAVCYLHRTLRWELITVLRLTRQNHIDFSIVSNWVVWRSSPSLKALMPLVTEQTLTGFDQNPTKVQTRPKVKPAENQNMKLPCCKRRGKVLRTYVEWPLWGFQPTPCCLVRRGLLYSYCFSHEKNKKQTKVNVSIAQKLPIKVISRRLTTL